MIRARGTGAGICVSPAVLEKLNLRNNNDLTCFAIRRSLIDLD